MAYAQHTTVTVDKSQSEMRKLLLSYGASKFSVADDHDAKTVAIQFYVRQRIVRFILSLPDKSEDAFWKTTTHGRPRSAESALALWEQACRSAWRALLLCLKAKLEAVTAGITEFDQEFLAYVVLADNQTVGERLIPQVARAYTDGTPLLGLEVQDG